MARADRSRAGIERLGKQKRVRDQKSKEEPQPAPEPPKITPTSFWLPVQLIEALGDTKIALQRETRDRKTYTASVIVRAALQRFIHLEMDDQITEIDEYLKTYPRAARWKA